MVQQTGNASILKRYAGIMKQAFEAHKLDETEYSSVGELPAGIEGGVARLVDCKVDLYKTGEFKGQPYFYAAGVVVSPKTHNGVRIEGLRTQLRVEPLCATPKKTRKTIEEHIGWVLNELRKLGLDTSSMEYEDLEVGMQALKENHPTFSFRTWKGKPTKQFPNPSINHQWGGQCQWSPEDAVDEPPTTEDDTEDVEGTDEGVDESKSGVSRDEERTGADKAVYENEEGEPFPEENGQVGVGEEGVEGEEESIHQEVQAVTPPIQTITAPVVTPKTDRFVPKVGYVYQYHPLDPRTKKPLPTVVECEVLDIAHNKETVSLKSLDDVRIKYSNVPWSRLG